MLLQKLFIMLIMGTVEQSSLGGLVLSDETGNLVQSS